LGRKLSGFLYQKLENFAIEIQKRLGFSVSISRRNQPFYVYHFCLGRSAFFFFYATLPAIMLLCSPNFIVAASLVCDRAKCHFPLNSSSKSSKTFAKEAGRLFVANLNRPPETGFKRWPPVVLSQI
jgi:hypothetical protein